MIDSMLALKSLENELGRGIVLIECELNGDIDLILDFPAGEHSMSYANIEQGTVKSLAVLAPLEPIKGMPCFGVHFAVNEAYQGQGLAAEIVEVAIAELRHGLGRNGIVEFYIEATIAEPNAGAQKVACQVLSTKFDKIFDGVTESQCYRYRRLVACV
jgi:GNAT superfamily N-acetyltransferase